MGGLDRLRALLREEGGLMATLVAPAGVNGRRGPADRASPAALAAEGPRAAGRREEYELLIEAIYEGYLLHYDAPRVVQAPEADLGLLAGDQLYAIGLARLVSLGDTIAVAELADTITLARSPRVPGSASSLERCGRRERVRSAGGPATPTGVPRICCSRARPRRSMRCAQAPTVVPAAP